MADRGAHTHSHVTGNSPAYRFKNFDNEAAAVRDGPAVAIGPVVELRAEKRTEQIVRGGLDFDDVDPRPGAALRRVGVIAGHLPNLGNGYFPGHLTDLHGRNRRGRQGSRATTERYVSAAVPENYGQPGAGIMDRLGGAHQGADDLVPPQLQLSGPGKAVRMYRG